MSEPLDENPLPQSSPENHFLINFTHKKDTPSDIFPLPTSKDEDLPRIPTPSFKVALLHDMSVDGNTVSSPTYEEDLLMDNTEDGRAKLLDPTIPFPSHVRENIYAPWKTSVIVKVIGKSFGYKTLLMRLTGIWRPKGNFTLIDLGYDFFLVKFFLDLDFMSMLERGPWFVGEHYLSIRKWEPQFQAAKATMSSLAA